MTTIFQRTIVFSTRNRCVNKLIALMAFKISRIKRGIQNGVPLCNARYYKRLHERHYSPYKFAREKPTEGLEIPHFRMGKHVLLHRERGNHRILEARLTQRNDTGLGFYLKGTQEQHLTVKKSDVSIYFIDS